MKLRTLIAIAFLIAHVLLHNYWRDKYYELGMSETEYSISNCTLEDARAERCYIPCSTDMDCVEKNGMEDH